MDLKTATSYINRLNSYVELGGKIVFFCFAFIIHGWHLSGSIVLNLYIYWHLYSGLLALLNLNEERWPRELLSH